LPDHGVGHDQLLVMLSLSESSTARAIGTFALLMAIMAPRLNCARSILSSLTTSRSLSRRVP
jgi:hypothetical protein